MKKIGTMNLILVIIGVLVVIFTTVMIVVYVKTGGIPDTLCTCFYSICGGECGVMAWIKNVKEKAQERKNELEDRKTEKE